MTATALHAGLGVEALERASISAFVARCADDGLFRGDVLDYGCGLQPYRAIVEGAGARYLPFDRIDYRGAVAHTSVGDDGPFDVPCRWDGILCTQVVQYWSPAVAVARLCTMRRSIKPGRPLVLTGPTNGAEVSTDDLFRWTLAGARRAVMGAGFRIVEADRYAEIVAESGWTVSLGYQIVALA